MTESTSAVTQSRYEQGARSFHEWLEIIDIRHDEFKANYTDYVPEEGPLNELKNLVETYGVKALIIGEAWCPDVWRGLPVIAKIAENTGMEASYFIRDDNKDIMSEFLNGEFESIPTIVFYDKDLNYIFHWIERPQEANEEMAKLRDKFLSNVPNEGEEKDAAMKSFRKEVANRSAHWRHLTLDEIVSSLKKHLTE